MNDQLIPQRLDPFKQVGAGTEMKGNIPLNCLERLEGLLADSEGSVSVHLHFFRDEQRIAVISGKIDAVLSLTCQRCLTVEKVNIEGAFLFALLRSEEDAHSLPDIYEPLVLDKPEIDLHALVEEELILALPIVFYHSEVCQPLDGKTTFGDQVEGAEKKPNPFAVLEKLKS